MITVIRLKLDVCFMALNIPYMLHKFTHETFSQCGTKYSILPVIWPLLGLRAKAGRARCKGDDGNWTFRPFVSSPPGRFAPWTFRHLDGAPPRRFATTQWAIRPLDWRIIYFVNNTNDFVAIASIYTIAWK